MRRSAAEPVSPRRCCAAGWRSPSASSGDGAIGGSGAEYINHCCEPNLRARLVQGHILYVSRRAIDRGEELTVDYQYAHDTDQMPCTCGAASCRGLMNLSRHEAAIRRARRRRRR